MGTEHDAIVESMFAWVVSYCNNIKDHYNIYADHLSSSRSYRPPEICGSIPDVFAISDDGHTLVVGEAETEETLLSYHTERQFIAFLNYCKRFSNSVFLVGVPWVVSVRARIIVKVLKKEVGCSNVRCLVLDTWELSNA